MEISRLAMVFYPIATWFPIGPVRFSTVQFFDQFVFGTVLIGATTAAMIGNPVVISSLYR